MDNFAFYSPTYFAFGNGSGKVYGFTTLTEEDVVNIYKLML